MSTTTWPRVSTIKDNIAREERKLKLVDKLSERQDIEWRIGKMREALEKAKQYHKAYKV